MTTKVELETELHNTRQGLREVLEYAFLTAIAAEHLAYAFLLQETEQDKKLVEKNQHYALQLMKQSYDLMPSEEWGNRIGYLWEIANTGKVQ